MDNADQNPEDDTKEEDQKQVKSTDQNVEEGKKIIDIQKKLQDTSEEESKEDAEKWRNEG